MKKYLIDKDATILDAMKKLDILTNEKLTTLFVTNNNKVVGSITDGDCRRGLIKGCVLDSKISLITNNSFIYLEKDNYSVDIIYEIKKKGIKNVPILNKNKELFSIVDFSSGKSFIPVDAVLMAGGLGKRLRPLTEKTPKPLLKVNNKPIIEYNINNLKKYGVQNIKITVNYLKEQIESYFEGRKDIKCVREPKFLGTIGSLQYIDDFKSDVILLMNSDLFTNVDLESFYLHFLKYGADMSVAAVPYDVHIPYGIFELKDQREIIKIQEKPSYHYYANAGIYLIKRELLQYIPKDTFFDATDFIEKLISMNKKVIRHPIKGYWIDIGNPEDFKMVQDFAANITGANI